MEFFIFVFFVVERRTKFYFSRYVVPTVFTRAYTFSFSETILVADLQAETGRYYNTRSRVRHHTANVITILVPSHNWDIESEYDMHMVNEITHAETGEKLNLRKLLLNPETLPDWQKGNYNEYGRLFH
jgi:hypothetical protein